MSTYYGITLHPSDVVYNGDIRDVSLVNNTSNIAWFANFDDAVYFARHALKDALPANTPGLAFIYTCANPILACESSYSSCVGIGGVPNPCSANMVFLNPPDVHSNNFEYHQFIYLPGIHDIKQLVDAYSWDPKDFISEDYQPKCIDPSTVYVHYGSTKFDIDCFTPAYTRMHDLKPEAGFWASPIDAQWSWRDWCQRESFCNDNPNCRIEFSLAADAKVFRVRTLEDIAYLIDKYSAPWHAAMDTHTSYLSCGLPALAIDYEAMAKDYDGLDYSYTALGNVLGCWDCDSVVIFNHEVMQFREIELVPEDPDAHYEQDDYDVADDDWEL